MENELKIINEDKFDIIKYPYIDEYEDGSMSLILSDEHCLRIKYSNLKHPTNVNNIMDGIVSNKNPFFNKNKVMEWELEDIKIIIDDRDDNLINIEHPPFIAECKHGLIALVLSSKNAIKLTNEDGNPKKRISMEEFNIDDIKYRKRIKQIEISVKNGARFKNITMVNITDSRRFKTEYYDITISSNNIEKDLDIEYYFMARNFKFDSHPYIKMASIRAPSFTNNGTNNENIFKIGNMMKDDSSHPPLSSIGLNINEKMDYFKIIKGMTNVTNTLNHNSKVYNSTYNVKLDCHIFETKYYNIEIRAWSSGIYIKVIDMDKDFKWDYEDFNIKINPNVKTNIDDNSNLIIGNLYENKGQFRLGVPIKEYEYIEVISIMGKITDMINNKTDINPNYKPLSYRNVEPNNVKVFENRKYKVSIEKSPSYNGIFIELNMYDDFKWIDNTYTVNFNTSEPIKFVDGILTLGCNDPDKRSCSSYIEDTYLDINKIIRDLDNINDNINDITDDDIENNIDICSYNILLKWIKFENIDKYEFQFIDTENLDDIKWGELPKDLASNTDKYQNGIFNIREK